MTGIPQYKTVSKSKRMYPLMHGMPGKNFSRRHFEIFFFIQRTKSLKFHANCLLTKTIIDLSSAKFDQSISKVNLRKIKQ